MGVHPGSDDQSADLTSHVWAVCQPWRLRDLDDFDGHPRGDRCPSCRREIAVDRTWTGKIICIYCAIERGWVEDGPIGERTRERIDRSGEAVAAQTDSDKSREAK